MPTAKPSKQRKGVFLTPDHKRYRGFAALLSSNLKATHGIRTLPVRSGDTVRIMRGDHKGFEGKVSRVDRDKYRVFVEGLTREKVDGSTIFVPIHPSKVMITNLVLDDKWRKKILTRKKRARKAEEIVEKPLKKPAKKPVEKKKEITAEKKATEEKISAEKPKTARKRRVKKEPVAKREVDSEADLEEKPKTKKPRAKRKTVKKTEGDV